MSKGSARCKVSRVTSGNVTRDKSQDNGAPSNNGGTFGALGAAVARAIAESDPGLVELLVVAVEGEERIGAGRWFVVGGADPEVILRAARSGYLLRKLTDNGPDRLRPTPKARELLGLLGRV